MSKEGLRKSLTWKDLRELIKLSTKRKYNRVLNIDFLFTNIKENYNELNDDTVFIASPLMVHEHKEGKKCEPHMRISVWVPGLNQIVLDCDMDLWRSYETLADATESLVELFQHKEVH